MNWIDRRIVERYDTLWLLQPEGQIEQEIYNNSMWEQSSTLRVESLVKRGDVVLDIGANLGWYSILCAKLGARVIAFEPDRQLVKLIRIHSELNHVGRLIDIHRCAVGTPGNSVDDFVAGRRVDFIKLDVDGPEFRILLGSHKTLEEYHPIILLEVCDDALRYDSGIPVEKYKTGSCIRFMLDYLKRLGYKFLWERGLQEVDSDACIDFMPNGSMNIFCTTPEDESLLRQ